MSTTFPFHLILIWDSYYLVMDTQAHPRGWSFRPGSSIIRGYDTSALFREDCLERIKHLQMEVNADLKQMEQGQKERAAIEERLKQMKKDRGWID